MTRLVLVKRRRRSLLRPEQEDYLKDEDASTKSVYTLHNAGLSINRRFSSVKRFAGTAGVPPALRRRCAGISHYLSRLFSRFALIAGGPPAVPDNHLTGSLRVLTSSNNNTAAVAPSAALTRNAVCGPRQSHKPPISSDAGSTVMPKARLYKP